jgi:hypothetical protein
VHPYIQIITGIEDRKQKSSISRQKSVVGSQYKIPEVDALENLIKIFGKWYRNNFEELCGKLKIPVKVYDSYGILDLSEFLYEVKL